MARASSILAAVGLGVGAGTTYFLDPRLGRQRRSQLRDSLTSGIAAGRDGAVARTRDVTRATHRTVATLKSRLHFDSVEDGTLETRIRARLGRLVSNPEAVDVAVQDGTATLTGAVLDAEAGFLCSAVRRIDGVRAVDDRMERHPAAGSVPSLLREEARPADEGGRLQGLRNPVARAAAGVAGGGLIALALWRRDVLAPIFGLAGAVLLTRSIDDRPLSSHVPRGRRLFRVERTLLVAVPPEEVYRAWSDPTVFPRFMSHLQEVRHLGGRNYRWKAAVPAGAAAEWDASVTARIPNRLIAWTSDDASKVRTAGSVHFEPVAGGTEIHLVLTYTPPAGTLGRALARALGEDPEHTVDADLKKLKEQLEAHQLHGAAGPVN